MKTSSPSSLNIVDTLFLFSVSESTKESAGKHAPLAYAELLGVLNDARPPLGFRAADLTFAVAAVDPVSDSQKRFLEALTRLRINVEGVDFRHAYVSTPRAGGVDRSDHSVSSLAPNLCYVLGLIAGRMKPEAVVVTGSFDVYWPLMDFVAKRGGRAALAFFRRFLDPRWSQVGLFEESSPIRWIDLEPHAQRLLGIELGSPISSQFSGPRGLAGI